MDVEEDSMPEQQLEELTKKEDKTLSQTAKLAQQLEQMGPSNSSNRP